MTRRLFARHGIATRLVSYHARNAAARGPELLAHLRGGADLALVTDAGTPLVSDPGGELVAAWAAEGGAVVPIPGPVGRPGRARRLGGRRARAGPSRGSCRASGRERRERLARLAADVRTTVLFEAPGPARGDARRPRRGLRAGPARPRVCRELTKLHEEIVRGGLGDAGGRRGRRRDPRARRDRGRWSGTPPAGARQERAGGAPAAARMTARGRPRRGRPPRRRWRRPRATRPAAWPPPRGSRGVASTAPSRIARIGAVMSATARLPVLGVLPPLARILVLATLGRLRSSAIVLDWGIGADPTLVFVVAGDRHPRARLDHRPRDGASRGAERTAGRRHPQRDLRQHRRADHRLLRPPGGAHRGREGVAHRVDHRQPAARPRRQRPRRRAPQRHPALRRADRRLERGAPRGRRDRLLRARPSSPSARAPASRGRSPRNPSSSRSSSSSATCSRSSSRSRNSSRTLGGHEPAAEHGGPAWSRGVAVVVLLATAGAARGPVGDPRRVDRAVHRDVRALDLLRRRHPDPDDRQPRRAPRRRPARLEEPDGVLDGGRLRLEPPGRPLRGPGARDRRRAHRPADGPRLPSARGRGGRRRGRHQRADRPRRRVELAGGGAAR